MNIGVHNLTHRSGRAENGVGHQAGLQCGLLVHSSFQAAMNLDDQTGLCVARSL